MTNKPDIPIHNFSKDDESSIPFRLIPLETRTDYDSSVPHRHNYYEIFFFEKGGGGHEVDFNSFPIENHSIHFVSPGQVHKINRERDSFGSIILFSRDFFYTNQSDKNRLFDLPFLNNADLKPILDLKAGEFSQLKSIIQLMEQEMKSNKHYQEEVLQNFLSLILLNAKRFFDANKSVGNKPSEFHQFKILLEKEFEKHHSVAAYASQLNVTEKQLSAITKKAVGKTALELIHERIVLEAKRLLRYSNYNVKEIAFFLHFDEPSHFGKFFKSKTGLTPNEFRKPV